MLSSTFLLLLAPAAATAKLWGWPDSFTVSIEESENAWAEYDTRVCSGWGNWCGNCDWVQDFQESVHAFGLYKTPTLWQWAHIKKENSAWIDFWRQGDSNSFNMYETNQDGTVHGQCQIVDFFTSEQDCGGGRKPLVLLNCWQW